MTVSTELQRMKTAIDNAYSAAEAKGATIPEIESSENLATTISSITPNLQDKIIRQNGTYTADSGYDGLNEVDVGIGQNGDTYTDVPNLSGISYAANDKVWLNYRPEVVAGNASTNAVPSDRNKCGIAAAFALDDTYFVIGCTGVSGSTSTFKTFNTSISGALTAIDTANSYANYQACIGLYTDESGNLILNHGGTYKITNNGTFVTKSNGQVFDETGIAKSSYGSSSVTLYYNDTSIGNGGSSSMYNSTAIIVAKGDYMYYLNPQGQGIGYLVSYNVTTGTRTVSSGISSSDSNNVYVTNNRKYLYIGARGSNDDKLATLGGNNPSINHTNLTNILTNSVVVGQNHYGSLTNDWLSLCKTDGSAFEIYKYDSVNDVFIDKVADFNIDTSLLTNFTGYYGGFAISADGKKILVPWIDSSNSTHATLYWYSRAAGWVIQKYDAINSDSITGYANEAIAAGATGDVIVGTKIEPTLGTKTITVNGTYNASSDNLDGYSSVTVDVPSGDTITAANNTGSAITSGNKVWVETESKNFTIVGSPTIVNKVVSNFSTSNYLQVSPLANTTSGTWTFDVEFTYVTNPYPPEASDPQSIVYFTDSGGDDRGVAIIEGILGGTIPSTNSDGYEYLESSTALTSGETYQLQIELTANSGKFYIKHNGSIIETLSGQNGTYMPASITGFNLGGTGNYDRFVGSINLNNTNIKINNSTAWSPYSPANPYYLINFTDISSSTITGIAKENIAVSGTGDVDIGTIIAPTKKYNLLDRVTDDSNNEIGTVSGFFTDANDVEYAVVCLDAQYRSDDVTWCSDNQTAVTDLPIYSTTQWGPWEAKETSTFNTQKILDFCTANGYTSGACSHCRTLSFTIDGTTYYGQVPNMIELNDIVRNHTALNTADTTASSYSSYDFSTGRLAWSSSQYSNTRAWIASMFGSMQYTEKNGPYFVAPVLEIPNT